MVTTIRKYTGGAHPFLEFACLSTDTKPVDLVPDNSICHEIDTGKKYYFANKAWHEAPARGGSGEGDSAYELPTASASTKGGVKIGSGLSMDGEVLSATGGGASSWNDLEDKPFYEETVPAINLEMPTGASYVEASFTATGAEPMTMPMKLYRAGGVYTAEQLVGATATLDNGEESPDSSTIGSDSFFEIEQDGETVGYLVGGEGVYAFIVLADNTVFNTSLDLFSETAALTSDNIPTAGTYLINIVVGEDEGTCTSITKAASTIVHQLDSKYIHAPLVVTITEEYDGKDINYRADKSVAEVLSAYQANRECKCRVPVSSSDLASEYLATGAIALLPLTLVETYEGTTLLYFAQNCHVGKDNQDNQVVINFTVLANDGDGESDNWTLNAVQVTPET